MNQPTLPDEPDTAAQALAQAEEYGGVFASTKLTLSTGETVTIPPHPSLNLLPDDRQADLEALLFEVETEMDRGPDIVIPPQKDKDGNVVLEGETVPGPVLEPHRKDGKLVTPPYKQRYVMAAIGQDAYDKLVKDGKSSEAVYRIWADQNQRIVERQKKDSKSS